MTSITTSVRADTAPQSQTQNHWSLILVTLAMAVRLAAILVLQSHTIPRSTYEHGEIAANLVAGRGFSIAFLGAEGPTSQQAPVYPALLALAYAALGVETPAALLAVQVMQALLSGLLVLGVMRLMSLWLPEYPWAGRLAGLLVAVHPTQIYTATHIQVASLVSVLLVWLLVWSERTARGDWRAAIVTGILFAVLILTDPILILAAPAVAWIIGRRSPSPAPSIRRLALVAAVTLVGLAPWLVRNARVHGEFVFVKSTFGYAFWQGNCALSEGTDKVVRASVDEVLKSEQANGSLASVNRALWAARHEAGYIDDIALSADEKAALGRLTEPERSRVLLRRVLVELRHDPGRYLRLSLQRLRYFVLFDESNPKTRHPLYRIGHLGLTLLAGLGWIVMGPAVRRRMGPSLLTAALLTLFHTLTIVSARFHVPIEPFLAMWAGGSAVPCFATTAYPRRLTVSYASGSNETGLPA